MSDETDSRAPIPPDSDDAAQRRRPGLPDPANVVGERELRSPKRTRYRIIKTRERDAYDKPDAS